jgi:hypothetical protein
MADYVVSETWGPWDGNYTAAGLGYLSWVTDHYELVTGSGTRQYYTLDGDPTRIMVYDNSGMDSWVLTETSSFPYDYYYSSTSTTPPVDVYWYTAYVTEWAPPTYEVEASNDVEFGVVAQSENAVIEVSAETTVEFGQDTHLTYEVEAESDIEFDQEAERLRVIYRDGDSAIEFDESSAQVRSGENGLELSHLAEAYVTKPTESGVEFSDSAIREPMEFSRAASNDIEFDDAGSAYNENDPAHGPCDDEYTCDRDHITLSCADPATTVDLRNPSDDSLKVILNIINRYSRAEELRETGVHPRFLQLHYQFTSMPASQKAAFIAFYKATAGLEITLMDFCSQRWVGCILDKEINFNREAGRTNVDPLCPEPDDGLYSWEFTFEGERIPADLKSYGTFSDTYIDMGFGYMQLTVGSEYIWHEGEGARKYYRCVNHPGYYLVFLSNDSEHLLDQWLITEIEDPFTYVCSYTNDNLTPPLFKWFMNGSHDALLTDYSFVEVPYYIVDGAGTTNWNGSYNYVGESGGQPYYELSGKYLYAVENPITHEFYWYLGETLGDEDTYYYYAENPGAPDETDWNSDGDLGELPAPTVVEGT